MKDEKKIYELKNISKLLKRRQRVHSFFERTFYLDELFEITCSTNEGVFGSH